MGLCRFVNRFPPEKAAVTLIEDFRAPLSVALLSFVKAHPSVCF